MPRCRKIHRRETLASGTPRFMNGLAISIDLEGDRDGLVGYRAKRFTGVIDVDRVGAYDVADFWEPIRRGALAEIVLDPAQFYILVSAEAVHVPPGYAAEMVPFDPLVGEFRVHYAGFFDPGFGHGPAGGHGSHAVLEVRSHEVPFILEHGQTIGRLVYEPMAALPGEPLRRGARLQLPGAGAEAFKAFPPAGRGRTKGSRRLSSRNQPVGAAVVAGVAVAAAAAAASCASSRACRFARRTSRPRPISVNGIKRPLVNGRRPAWMKT